MKTQKILCDQDQVRISKPEMCAQVIMTEYIQITAQALVDGQNGGNPHKAEKVC